MPKIRATLVLIALFTSSLSYMYGYFHQSEDAIYTGMRSINASDYTTHLSWIDQSRKGDFFLQNKFTADPQRGDFVRPVYYLLSQPFRLTDLSNAAAFHIMRVVCGGLLLFLLFPVLRQFERDERIVLRAFALVVFSSGLGFLVRQWSPSADLDVPESILFVSLGEAPHFLYSLLFLWTGIATFYSGNPAIYFVSLLLLWWEHPFEAVVLIVVCCANLWVLKSHKIKLLVLLITGGISLPPFLYYRHLQTLPAFSGWGSAQNLMNSPPFVSYLFAFLPLMVFSVSGIQSLRKQHDKKPLLIFVCVWTLVQFLLAYSPFPFQRRLIAGVQLPLAILAAHGFVKIRRSPFAIFTLLLLSATNVFLTARLIDELRPRQMPLYLTASYDQAFRWLARQERQDGVVLSGFITGNLIPGFTGFQSYLGHSSLTPEIAKKRIEVRAFYQEPAMSFVLRNRIRYVFWGLEERRLSEVDLTRQYGTVFQNDEVTILDPHLKIENMNIVVGGHSRNIGKTSVVAGIIARMRNQDWTAMKITQFGHGICSRNGKACHCSTEEHRYAIVEEKNPNGRGDSCRFLAAGAQRSIWVRTKQGMLRDAMPEISEILKEAKNTIIESNSILEFFNPDLYLVVLDYGQADFKASSRKFLERADACIVVNSHPRRPVWNDVSFSLIADKRIFYVSPPKYVDDAISEFIQGKAAKAL